MAISAYIRTIVLTLPLIFSGCYRSDSSGSKDDTNTGTNSVTDTSSDSGTKTDSESTLMDTETVMDIDTETTLEPDTDSGPCAPMDARQDETPCNTFLGVVWDGRICKAIYCECAGDACDRLYNSQQECVNQRSSCMDACPLSDYPNVLTADNDGCLCGEEQYRHCCPDGMDYCACDAATARTEAHLLCGEGGGG